MIAKFDAAQMLRNKGLKVTIPRVKIYELMQQSEEPHVSAEDLYKLLIAIGLDIGISTVYRVLSQFEEKNLVTKHNFEANRSLYELTNKEPHDHIICTDCGKVFEFTDSTIDSLQREISKSHGMKLHDQGTYLYGSCDHKDDCNDKDKNNEEDEDSKE